jgi:hypothetical protein
MAISSLSETDINDIVEKLSKLPPGSLPYKIFVEFARLKVTPILEIIPLCFDPTGQINVALFKRPVDDQWWPDLYHFPGFCLLPGDLSASVKWGLPPKAYRRFLKTELKGIKCLGIPVMVGYFSAIGNRGPSVNLVYVQPIDYRSSLPFLFPVSRLPSDIVSDQKQLIVCCTKVFVQHFGNNLK